MKKATDSRAFHFKQFSMHHHQSTMKIGTDAMILSAWVDLSNVHHLLDVGTGSGIIALMMAARSNAYIDAVELDEDSVKEAQNNFNQSPFTNKFSIYHNDYKTFAKETKTSYDLVISNPPFFVNDMRPENNTRKQARHTDSLSFADLCWCTKRVLKKSGKFCLVLPYSESKIFIREAENQGFYLNKKLLIFPKPCKEPNRVNLDLSLQKSDMVLEEKFIIRNESGKFTKQYVDLLGKYYTNINN